MSIYKGEQFIAGFPQGIDLPLGYHFYQGEGMQPNSGFLASNGQWNNGDLYKGFYNYYSTKIGDKFAGGYVKDSGDTYDDYDLVINQDDMTFRLPIYDGSESITSDKYDDLTLKDSGSTYEAPANGWYTASKGSTASNQFLYMTNGLLEVTHHSGASGENLELNIKVAKGNTVHVYYNAAGVTNRFRFIYAKGTGTLYFKVGNTVVNQEEIDVGEVVNVLADKANTDLSNLTTEGKKHFLNKTQLTNCILEAPNGVATYEDTTITVKAGLKVLIPNGRNADGTLNNFEYTVSEDVSRTFSTTSTDIMYPFIFLRADGYLTIQNEQRVLYQETELDLTLSANSFQYVISENKWYSIEVSTQTATQMHVVPILQAKWTSDGFTPTQYYHPVDVNVPSLRKFGNDTKLGNFTVVTNNSDFTTIYLKNYNLDRTTTTTPSSLYGTGRVLCVDKNGLWTGSFQSYLNTVGNMVTTASACRTINDTVYTATLHIGVTNTGTPVTYAPNCSQTGSIITTAGLNKSSSGYLKMGNGVIIQWGTKANSTDSNGTVTLPTAFTSTTYKVVGSDVGSAILSVAAVPSSSTQFKWWISGSGTRAFNWIAIGY